MQAGPFGEAVAEEALLNAELAEASGSVHRVAPEDADDVVGLERRLHVFGVGLSGGDGILLGFPTVNILVAVLEAHGVNRAQDGTFLSIEGVTT